ncbi:MAG: protein phosphatase 2C domain-containing protein [Planctomycetota bacterium]
MSVESLVFTRRDTEAAEIVPLARGRAAVFTTGSPEREGPNEDAVLLVSLGPERAVLAVADGAGGAPAGDQAAAVALESVLASLGRAVRGEVVLREAILAGFEVAHRGVAGLGVGAATTLAVAGLEAESVRTYHVGDSGVVVVGQRGKRKLQTLAHSPVGYAVEAGLLDEREAMHHEERHLVSNLIGQTEMRVDMSAPLGLAPRDTLLLASDGLLDNLHLDEVLDTIRKGPLEKAAAGLAEAARRRMHDTREGVPSKPDDLTFVLYRAEQRPVRPPPPA